MAFDKSEPRTKMIVGVGLLSIVSLIVIRFGLQSYFAAMMAREDFWKVGSFRDSMLETTRAAETRNLDTAPLSIRRAMDMLTRTGMTGARPAAISIAPSSDTGALQGWGVTHPMNSPPAYPLPTPLAPAPAVVPQPAVAPAPAPGTPPPPGTMGSSDGPGPQPTAGAPVVTPAGGSPTPPNGPAGGPANPVAPRAPATAPTAPGGANAGQPAVAPNVDALPHHPAAEQGNPAARPTPAEAAPAH